MNTSAKIRRGRVVSPHFQSMMKCLYHEFKVGRKFSQNILNQVSTGKELHHGSWSLLSHHSHWVTQEWMVPRYSTRHPGPIFHWHRLHARNRGCWSLPWAHLNLQVIFAKVFPRPPKPLQTAAAMLSCGDHFTPRPNLPVIPGISWLPTFAFQYLMMKRTSFFWCYF